MAPYNIVHFEIAETRFGENILATIVEWKTGDKVVLNVYLPHMFLAILSVTTSEN